MRQDSEIGIGAGAVPHKALLRHMGANGIDQRLRRAPRRRDHQAPSPAHHMARDAGKIRALLWPIAMMRAGATEEQGDTRARQAGDAWIGLYLRRGKSLWREPVGGGKRG